MTGTQLEFDFGELTNPFGALSKASRVMVAALVEADVLEAVHAPLVATLYKVASALEGASGRGASAAMLSAELREVYKMLIALMPDDVDGAGADTEYEVVLLQPVMADAS